MEMTIGQRVGDGCGSVGRVIAVVEVLRPGLPPREDVYVDWGAARATVLEINPEIGD